MIIFFYSFENLKKKIGNFKWKRKNYDHILNWKFQLVIASNNICLSFITCTINKIYSKV